MTGPPDVGGCGRLHRTPTTVWRYANSCLQKFPLRTGALRPQLANQTLIYTLWRWSSGFAARSPLYSPGLRSSEAHRCSLQGWNQLSVLRRAGSPPPARQRRKSIRSPTRSICVGDLIVTSSVCSSSGPTVVRPASVQDRRDSRAVLQGYAKSLSVLKLLTWESCLPGLARLRSPARPE